jgi:hypothetical protein
MGLDPDEFTPLVVLRGTRLSSEVRGFGKAARLARLLDLEISEKTLERLMRRIGLELAARAAGERGTEPLAKRPENPPALAVVECDGGRIRVREPGRGPGVHLADGGTGWRETKAACLVRATLVEHAADPRPDPPACFLDPVHAARIAETEALSAAAPLPDDDRRDTRDDDEELEMPSFAGPRPLVRTVLAGMVDAREFGKWMAREAHRRRFNEAPARAFLGDGLAWNWSIWKRHFADYVPILDFVHPLSYLHAVAKAVHADDPDTAWADYGRWLTACWQGRVDEVIGELRAWGDGLGPPPEDAAPDDAARLVARTVGYLENNRERMDYPAYRRAGLPVTTAWMESTVKELNHRVKGTEMFWNDPEGAHAALQVRAATLGDDARLTDHLRTRAGCPFRRRSTMKRTPRANIA